MKFQVISAITKGQAQSNTRRTLQGLYPIETLALEHRPQIFKDFTSNFRTIKNLKTYYNFFNDNTQFKSVMYSDLRNSFVIKYEDKTEKQHKHKLSKKLTVRESKIIGIKPDFLKMVMKKERIESILKNKPKKTKKVCYKYRAHFF